MVFSDIMPSSLPLKIFSNEEAVGTLTSAGHLDHNCAGLAYVKTSSLEKRDPLHFLQEGNRVPLSVHLH